MIQEGDYEGAAGLDKHKSGHGDLCYDKIGPYIEASSQCITHYTDFILSLVWNGKWNVFIFGVDVKKHSAKDPTEKLTLNSREDVSMDFDPGNHERVSENSDKDVDNGRIVISQGLFGGVNKGFIVTIKGFGDSHGRSKIGISMI